MTKNTRSFRPSPALVISCVALFVALAGTAFAAGVVGKNSVRSAQIVDGAVHTADLHDGAVDATKVAPDAIGSGQIADNAVGSAEVQEAAIGSSDLARITTLGIGVEVPAGADGEAIADCPAGTTVISGGAQSPSPAISIYESAAHGNGWIVKAHNSANKKEVLAALAYCLTPGGTK